MRTWDTVPRCYSQSAFSTPFRGGVRPVYCPWIHFRGKVYEETLLRRLQDRFIESVFYIFKSEDEANASTGDSGSGFFYARQAKIPCNSFIFAVTNHHSVDEKGDLWIRWITEGEVSIRKISAEEWISQPDQDDLAIVHISYLPNIEKMTIVYEGMNVKSSDAHIGLGTETVAFSRFRGIPECVPTLRTGHVISTPQFMVQSPHGRRQLTLLVESRSVNGDSGSPVFAVPPQRYLMSDPDDSIKLLGVNFGHQCSRAEVKDAKGNPTGCVAIIHSTTSLVIPIHRLVALVDYAIGDQDCAYGVPPFEGQVEID